MPLSKILLPTKWRVYATEESYWCSQMIPKWRNKPDKNSRAINRELVELWMSFATAQRDDLK